MEALYQLSYGPKDPTPADLTRRGAGRSLSPCRARPGSTRRVSTGGRWLGPRRNYGILAGVAPGTGAPYWPPQGFGPLCSPGVAALSSATPKSRGGLACPPHRVPLLRCQVTSRSPSPGLSPVVRWLARVLGTDPSEPVLETGSRPAATRIHCAVVPPKHQGPPAVFRWRPLGGPVSRYPGSRPLLPQGLASSGCMAFRARPNRQPSDW